MSGREDTLRSQMVREAEGAIDELLRGAGQQGRDLTLTDIEQLVRKAGQRVMERLTECMVEAEAEKRSEVHCPVCGRRMGYKGKKERSLVVETGEIRWERDYYYCKTCEKGLFPPG